MTLRQREEILQMSVDERLRLAEEIWDSIAANPSDLPVTDAQREELDRRLADYRQNPDAGRTWDEVRNSLNRNK